VLSHPPLIGVPYLSGTRHAREEATMRKTVNCTITLVAAALALSGAAVPATASTWQAPNPANFVRTVSNPWFPLRPGATFVYHGVKDRMPSRDVVHVSGQTKLIQSVRCTAVSDRLYLSGKLAERTTDWYAQDRSGTVWYFGEDTAELDAKGRVTSTQGTWQAGVNGAQAGVFMPLHLRVGQSFRQEYLKGQAEDHFQVLSLKATVRTPAVSSKTALLTKEWTPLEPSVLDHKLYVKGVGLVNELTVKGGNERNTLVSRSG
jgi:hypothetical protein